LTSYSTHLIQSPMTLDQYFAKLIKKVESSDEITNQGKDENGFFKPTRTLVLRHLQMLKDLHTKPLAKPMLKDAWKVVVENLPPEYLVMTDEEKAALTQILS